MLVPRYWLLAGADAGTADLVPGQLGLSGSQFLLQLLYELLGIVACLLFIVVDLLEQSAVVDGCC